MKIFSFLSAFLLVGLSIHPMAHALDRVTHTAQLDLELTYINEKGKSDKVGSRDGKVSMDWDTGGCELVTQESAYPCKLDLSSDLVAADGEILMKAVPKIHFEGKSIDLMLRVLGLQDKKLSLAVNHAVQESSASRSNGYDVPWYALRDQQEVKTGQTASFWSGFAGLYLDLNVRAPESLGQSRSFTLRFHLYRLKAVRGAFNIIGNNGAGNFGQ